MKRFVEDEGNFQGDVGFWRVDAIPADAVKQDREGAVIVTHSETGHHHSFDAGASVWLYSTPDQLKAYLDVKAPSVLKHHRAWDTHEEIEFPVGTYEIRRQREYTPDGWRQVQD